MAGVKEKCPHCGKSYASVYLWGDHMRKAHGIWGGKTGRLRKKGMPPRPTNNSQAVEVFNPPKPTAPKFKVLPFIVLEDQDGHMWLAERMER
jgi:hypothetical protein